MAVFAYTVSLTPRENSDLPDPGYASQWAAIETFSSDCDLDMVGIFLDESEEHDEEAVEAAVTCEVEQYGLSAEDFVISEPTRVR